MTITNPPVSEIGAYVQAASIRRLATSFIRGVGGLVEANDLQVSGNPAALSLNITAGGIFLRMPDLTYDLLYSDATEARNIPTPPSSGTRYDLLYAGIESKEFGDGQNFANLRYKTGTTSDTNGPDPDTMAGTSPIALVRVPNTATKGTDCTITMLTSTTAPVRDGGFKGGDIVLPTQPYLAYHRSGIGTNGHIIANNGAPFVPKFVQCIGTYPRAGVYRPNTFVVEFDGFAQGRYTGYWYNQFGDPLSVDPGIGYAEWVAIMWPNTVNGFPPG